MGNDRRRRLVHWLEDAVWEHRYWTVNAARRNRRHGKRHVTRRERREARAETRAGQD